MKLVITNAEKIAWFVLRNTGRLFAVSQNAVHGFILQRLVGHYWSPPLLATANKCHDFQHITGLDRGLAMRISWLNFLVDFNGDRA